MQTIHITVKTNRKPSGQEPGLPASSQDGEYRLHKQPLRGKEKIALFVIPSALNVMLSSKKGIVNCRFVDEVTLPLGLALSYWYSLTGSTDRLILLAYERAG